MSKKATCGWCHALLEVKGDEYDSRIHTVYCSPACRMADHVFRQWQSDEEINRREHYRYLTRGEDDG